LISDDLVVINPLPNKFNPKMQLEYSVQVRSRIHRDQCNTNWNNY